MLREQAFQKFKYFCPFLMISPMEETLLVSTSLLLLNGGEAEFMFAKWRI